MANSLADNNTATITDVKSFIVEAPRCRRWQLNCSYQNSQRCFGLFEVNLKKEKVRKVQLRDKTLGWYYQNFLRKSYEYFYCGGALTSKD